MAAPIAKPKSSRGAVCLLNPAPISPRPIFSQRTNRSVRAKVKRLATVPISKGPPDEGTSRPSGAATIRIRGQMIENRITRRVIAIFAVIFCLALELQVPF